MEVWASLPMNTSLPNLLRLPDASPKDEAQRSTILVHLDDLHFSRAGSESSPPSEMCANHSVVCRGLEVLGHRDNPVRRSKPVWYGTLDRSVRAHEDCLQSCLIRFLKRSCKLHLKYAGGGVLEPARKSCGRACLSEIAMAFSISSTSSS
jgi:hypothetical protein